MDRAPRRHRVYAVAIAVIGVVEGALVAGIRDAIPVTIFVVGAERADVVAVADAVAVAVVRVVRRAQVASIGHPVAIAIVAVVLAGAGVVRVADPVTVGIVRIVEGAGVTRVCDPVAVEVDVVGAEQALVIARASKLKARGSESEPKMAILR